MYVAFHHKKRLIEVYSHILNLCYLIGEKHRDGQRDERPYRRPGGGRSEAWPGDRHLQARLRRLRTRHRPSPARLLGGGRLPGMSMSFRICLTYSL